HHDVHRVVRGCPHRRLDFSVEGNDRGSAPEDRAPATALYRCDAARLRADLAPEVAARINRCRPPPGDHHGRHDIYPAGPAPRAAASTTPAAPRPGTPRPSSHIASR